MTNDLRLTTNIYAAERRTVVQSSARLLETVNELNGFFELASLLFLISVQSEYFVCVDVDHETNMNEGG